MDRELLESGLERIGIPFTGDTVDKISSYVGEIMLFNPAYKLVGDKDADEILIRHVLASAAAYPVFMSNTEPGSVIADLGSGAGFPGMVLAILMPDRHFVLVERMIRRSQFLALAIARTGLRNTECDEKDLKEEKRVFDAVTARAFHPLYDIAEEVTDVITPDSVSLFYKGQRQNAVSELDVLRGEGYSFDAEVLDLKVPYLDERRTLCVLRNWTKNR